MPVFNFSVPLTSALIEYGGVWDLGTIGLASPDAIANSGDQVFGVSFTFNGTGVAISGSRQPDKPCNMSVTLDGSTQLVSLEHGVNLGGVTSDNEILFAQKDLDARAMHQLSMNIPVMTNGNSSQSCVSLGLQFVNITAGDGQMNTYMNNTVLDVNSDDITYDPPAAWDNVTENGLTMVKSTPVYNSTVEFVFEGNAIAVYGGAAMVPYGMYDINATLDGVQSAIKAPYGMVQETTTLLFFFTNLNDGVHHLMLRNLGEYGGLLVASATVGAYVPNPLSASTSGFSASSTQSSASAAAKPVTLHSTPVGAIAGGVVGGVTLLVIAGLLVFILARRHLKRRYGRVRFNLFEEDPLALPSTSAPTEDPREPAMEEVDLPPPNYQRIFPVDHAHAPLDLGVAGSEAPPRTPDLSRDGVGPAALPPGAMSPSAAKAVVNRLHGRSAALDPAARQEQAGTRTPGVPSAATLTWKGQEPAEKEDAEPSGTVMPVLPRQDGVKRKPARKG